jgi:hydroxyquinol 1,2-dioxygenase
VFVAGGRYLDSGAVFAVKHSLVRPFERVDDAELAAARGLPEPFWRVHVPLVLDR